MADGKQCPAGWGAAAIVENWTKEINPHKELITVMLREQAGPATAEAVAVLLGLRLLRRCNTNAEYLGVLIVDRPACFANLCELVDGSTRIWKEEHYEGVLRTILNDVQRAADDRRTTLKEMIVHLVSREKAVGIIGNRDHMAHDWPPHRRLAEAFQTAQKTQRNRDDGCVADALHETAQRTWRIKVEEHTPGQELLLRVTPNPWELPPCPGRPVPRFEAVDRADRD